MERSPSGSMTLVSGLTVSGLTVSGLTVSGLTVSGLTVSGLTVSGVTSSLGSSFGTKTSSSSSSSFSRYDLIILSIGILSFIVSNIEVLIMLSISTELRWISREGTPISYRYTELYSCLAVFIYTL